MHTTGTRSKSQELARQGRIVGYDPNFAAGYSGGVTLNASAKLQALVAVLLGDLVSTTVAYKMTVFAMAVVGPAMVVVAAITLRLAPATVWFSAALGLCLWWASGFRWFHTAGMASFVFGSYLGLAYTALLLSAATQPANPRRIVSLGLLGALGLFVHPLFPVQIALGLVAYLLSSATRFEFERRWPHLPPSQE